MVFPSGVMPHLNTPPFPKIALVPVPSVARLCPLVNSIVYWDTLLCCFIVLRFSFVCTLFVWSSYKELSLVVNANSLLAGLPANTISMTVCPRSGKMEHHLACDINGEDFP